MTLAQILVAIKDEARVKTGTNLDAMIKLIVQELLRDHGNKARFREVLAIDTPVTLVGAQSTYALPVDFQHMQAVRYSLDGNRFRPLYEFNEGQLRVSSVGYPRYYQLCSTGLLLFPSSLVLASQSLLISYYKDPASLYLVDADAFPIPRLEPSIKKNAIARVIRYMQNLKEAQMVTADAAMSFDASQGGQ